MEKTIGKQFVEGEIPAPQEICKKQLFKVMDQILKTDVDEEQIAPFMEDINRYFEYVDKEDIIKKIVSLEFGKFLAYYANAPEIGIVSKEKGGDRKGGRGGKKGNGGGSGGRKAEAGFRRLFLNIGKADGFYPGEVMQYINRHIHGHQEVGHIDLLSKISYIEVPEGDAKKVMRALDGTVYKGRKVRCNDAEDGGKRGGRRDDEAPKRRGGRKGGDFNGTDDSARFSKKSKRKNAAEGNSKEKRSAKVRKESGRKDDWKQFFQHDNIELIGDEPDFSEEGWARRNPKK